MISNTDDVNQEIETQSINLKMIDFSLWESRSAAAHDLIKYYSFDIKDFAIISVLGFFLVTTAMLGFGFYLWFLKGSNEHTQSRLLNILNGYLAAVCMTFSLALFIKILHHQRFTSAKIYEKNVPDDELMQNEEISARVILTFGLVIGILLLLISFTTVLNHFKPGLYLRGSLIWRHKIAISVMVISFIFAEHSLHASCDHLDPITSVIKCEAHRMRTMVMIPSTVTSFLCQIIVVVDDIWGWKNIYNALRRCLRPNIVTQINHGDIEMVGLPAAPGQELYHPSHNLNHHVEFVSLTTGFITLCIFNMIMFLIGILTTLFEVFNFIGPGLAWLVTMAVIPTIWITRNKKMTDKIKEIFLK